MSTPESRIVVAIETLLRGMPKASRDLATFEKRLRALENIKVATKPISTVQIDKAALAAQRLQLQQQKLAIIAQELANRQERARQAADRLAKSQERLAQQSAKASRGLGANADAHVKAFRAIETGAKRNKAEVDKINADTARQAKEQARIQEQSAKVIAQTQVANAKAGANALIDSLNKSSLAGDRLEKILTRVGATLNRIGAGLASFGRTLTVALTAPLAALGAISVKSASDLDAQINTLRAFTGSSEAAERRLSELIATAQRTPGLTTQLGLMLDAQLRLANVTVETIDKVAPAIGRLNAVQKLQDPSRFAQNLVQLVTQNFERIDLKELVGQSPVAGQLIKEIFNVDSPINAEAIRASAKRLGLTTTDAFFAAFAEAASRNEALATVTESIATRFSKFMDRVTLALRPLGLSIVNALTPIADFVVPIIERLSRAFASMPAPVQLVIVAFGALAAAAGPLILITGHLISGVGTLVTAYGRLVALGLTPTIKGFQLLGQVMRGTAALTAGQAATTAAASAGWIALGGAIAAGVAVLAVAAVALASYATEQEKAVDIDKDAAAARLKRIPQLKTEVQELEGLARQQELSNQQQEKLKESYDQLSGASRGRIALVEDESARLRTLIELKREQLRLDQFEANATAVQLVKNLTIALTEQQAAQNELTAARNDYNNANTAALRNAQQFGQFSSRQTEALERQEKASLKAADALEKVGQKGKEVEAAAQVIQSLAEASGRTTEQLLQMAQAAGANATSVEQARKAIKGLVTEQENLIEVVAQANKELLAQNEALKDLENDPTVVIAKSADDALASVLKFIKANTTATEDARRALQNYIQLFPQLAKAVERAGGVDAVIDSLTKKSTKKSETGLRNAREQLANALLRIAEAEIEQRNTAERLGNDRLLQANENSYRLQLIAYRDYLKARALLTENNLKLEIEQEALKAANAREAQFRLLAAAQKAGIPQAERVKRQAQAAAEEEKAIQAETKLKELEEQRAIINDDLRQLFAEGQKEQIEAVRKLDIEYAQLTGRIEDALDAATVDKFREALLRLGKEQDSINKDLAIAQAKKDADAIADLERARQLNQSQIDLIQGIVEQERALNKLTVANEFIRRAKEEQAELERQIGFEVEFRGLKEEEAIRRRLEGEKRLADSLAFERNLLQKTIDRLDAAKLPVPQALLEALRDINAAIAGLNELPFSEQFRLAQQEFDRINDLRIQKIQDVERAVRNRDIAEVEGAILIRKINGQYVGDLERQLQLLKQIAAQSGNRSLQQQAESTAETVKDVKDEFAGLGRQIESAGKDAARSGFTDFFNDLLNRTSNAKDALLDLIDSIATRINDVIAENLSKALFESIFGAGNEQGLLDKALGFFGLGNKKEAVAGGVAGVATEQAGATAAATALTAGAAATATALTTGGAAAATALTTAGASASTTLVSSVAGAATSFAGIIVGAASTFAGIVAGIAGGSQAVGGLGSALGATGAAKGSIFSPQPGGQLAIVAEGGYPEAVLTTDPKYAARQYEILKHYLKHTRGLFGRIPQHIIPRFETGTFISPRQTEMNLLSSITRGPSPLSVLPQAALASAEGKQARGLRIILVKDMREVRDYINSAEGEQVIVERLGRNSTFKTMVRG